VRAWLLAAALGCDGPDEGRPPQPPAQTGDTAPPAPQDSDGDGFLDSEDCAPDDPEVHPGAREQCNGLDDDCDGTPDPSMDRDEDGDGFLWCQDCDDERAERSPGNPDVFGDQLDSDCDGTDGVGTTMPAPFRTGGEDWLTSGWALAGGDVDGDGCAELLIGEPGWGPPGPTPNAAALGIGCWPWDELPSIEGEGSAFYMGRDVSLAPGLVVIYEAGWGGPRGRVLVYDETFGPETTPLLEVLGGASQGEADSMAVLGEPAQWLLLGRQANLDFLSAYYLVDLERRGTLDLEIEEPDLVLSTDSTSLAVGFFVGDVGDRDGDGMVDLGVIGDEGARQVRFFPQVTGGHVDDAPEIWNDGAPGEIENLLLAGGGDLDGDGRSEALEASLFGQGQEVDAGRVFLVPWMGPGEWDLAEQAPTRLDGEFTLDLLGHDSEVVDLDGDGQDDLVIGAPGFFPYEDIPGKVMIFPGPLAPGVLTTADASLVWVGEQMGDHAGTAVAAGDFDGSGRLDVAIGAPLADRDGYADAGAVYVLIDPL
jgi:hypothetical protein